MAHTTFRKSVPYNTIRLGGDVAQWSKYEITSADNSSYANQLGIQNVSMADMQRASGTNWDPDQGRVATGLLKPMRYGISSVSSDVSTGDGVFGYQVNGTTSPFVTQRQYNAVGTIENVRLSRMAQWDYTAAVAPADMDEMDFYNGGSSIWLQTSSYGMELFKDQQIWGFGVKKNGDNSTRRSLLLRSNKMGDKFSTYPQTNICIGTHSSDMNDINMLLPLITEYGRTLGSGKVAYLTVGRRTSSTSQLKAQVYTLTISQNGTWSTATSGSPYNFTSGAGSNFAVGGGCIVRDGLVLTVGGKGNSGQYVQRLSWNGSTLSSTNATLTSTSGQGAVRSDIVSTDNFGASNNRTAAVFIDTKSTWNRYCKIQMYNMNSGISTVGSNFTVFDVNNSLKAVKMDTLYTDSNYMEVIVAVTDTSGDVRLQVVRWNYGGNSWEKRGSAVTYQYNDTSVQNWHGVSTLSAVEKTAILKSGENFTPGGTNDFDKRVYFVLSVSTNSETDDVELAYFYYDVSNSSIVSLTSGVAFSGRNAQIAKSPYGTDSRSNLDNLPIRNEAGPIYMPLLGGRYVSSTVKNLSIAMGGLDYKPDWGNSATGDPGGSIIGTTGLLFTDDTAMDVPSNEADWGQQGIWKVIAPHPNPDNVPPSTSGYSLQASNRNQYGYQFGGIGANLDFFTANILDNEDNNWLDWFRDTLLPYSMNQTFYVKIATNNGSLSATFTVSAGGKRTALVNDDYLYVDWRGGSNSHAGSSWAFLWQGNESTLCGITFSTTPF